LGQRQNRHPLHRYAGAAQVPASPAARQPDPAAFERELDSHQPSGRSGTPEEVGQLCLFLASDAASYITGAEIIISSGSELGYGVKFPWKLT
jgi:NAD(P)-dependent dehydrogenase (short-subunit alcohol dehydrogenase family)